MKVFVLAALVLPLLAHAEETGHDGSKSFICTAEAEPNSGDAFLVREIITANEKNFVTLQGSSGRVIRAKNYAVIIETIPDTIPFQKIWEVLTPREFVLIHKSNEEFLFRDFKNLIDYTCSPNYEFHTNLAKSRSK